MREMGVGYGSPAPAIGTPAPAFGSPAPAIGTPAPAFGSPAPAMAMPTFAAHAPTPSPLRYTPPPANLRLPPASSVPLPSYFACVADAGLALREAPRDGAAEIGRLERRSVVLGLRREGPFLRVASGWVLQEGLAPWLPPTLPASPAAPMSPMSPFLQGFGA